MPTAPRLSQQGLDPVMPQYSLDSILDKLHRFHQRATYGAVAELVGQSPHYLMNGRPRDARHSWIVNQESRLPTGYSKGELHSEIIARATVLSTPEELYDWLRNPV